MFVTCPNCNDRYDSSIYINCPMCKRRREDKENLYTQSTYGYTASSDATLSYPNSNYDSASSCDSGSCGSSD